MSAWEGLNPPYRTIVADPPWHYERNKGTWPPANARAAGPYRNAPLAYKTMTIEEIAAMPLGLLADGDCHLYLWTTNRYLRDAFDIVSEWGFRSSATLVWSKPPKGIAGDFVCSAEFIIFAKHGVPKALSRHVGSVFHWPRPPGHSTKPAAFYDVVEQVSPGPYVELFARQPRLGWDAWGHGYESESA